MSILLVTKTKLLWPDRETGPWNIVFYLANDNGHTKLIGVDIHGFSGSGVGPPLGSERPEVLTANQLRAFPIMTLSKEALVVSKDFLMQHYVGPPEDSAMARNEILGLIETNPGRPPSPTPTDDLQRVAQIYLRGGNAPVRAVAKEMMASYSSAKALVKKARDAGYLPRVPGRAKVSE